MPGTPLARVVVALIALVVTGGLSWASRRRGSVAQGFALVGGVSASVLGLFGVVSALASGASWDLQVPWSMAGSSLHVGMDPLTAWFLLPVFFGTAVCTIFGVAYLKDEQDRAGIGRVWLFFMLLAAGMGLVTIARDGLLFLLGWEVMALSPLFLVLFDHHRSENRRAAWIYLVASHVGAACLLVMFMLLASPDGSLDFSGAAGAALTASQRTIVFALAVVGFGSKAGFMPLHFWLPEAHPAAPSHASALMSGVMIKMGIYGLLRVLILLGAPQERWGWMLVAIGAVSGVGGVLFALAQHDLKRLLAYHSVENIGIITLGLGLGVIGQAKGNTPLMVLGYAGGLLHVLNHSLFKSLLFLGAGSVAHATGTGDLEQLGGLAKRMPTTAATFAIGAAAIVGLPPLNGFVSEFLIFTASFGALSGTAASLVPSLVCIASLGIIGGLAAACFVKAHGAVFLGQPRSDAAAHAHESSGGMRAAMAVFAAACVAVGLAGAVIIPWLAGPIATIVGGVGMATPLAAIRGPLAEQADTFASASLIYVGLFVVAIALFALRRWLNTRQPAETAETWGCGYAGGSARVQYTASSFAHPLTRDIAPALRTQETAPDVLALFPSGGALHTHTPDPILEGLLAPLVRALVRRATALRVLQQGTVHLYVLYIAVTLIVLLWWAQ